MWLVQLKNSIFYLIIINLNLPQEVSGYCPGQHNSSGGQHYGKKNRMKLGEQEEGLMTEWLRKALWGTQYLNCDLK